MMMTFVMLIFLAVPVAALLWRVVYSRSRWPRRLGAAAAGMLTLVGAFVAEHTTAEGIPVMRIVSVRDGIALLAAASGSIYLLLWGLRHRGRGRNKTLSILAAIIGFVPIVSAIAVAMLYPE
jgi:hypothetical protein